jgi:hypothetical protein
LFPWLLRLLSQYALLLLLLLLLPLMVLILLILLEQSIWDWTASRRVDKHVVARHAHVLRNPI